MDAGLFSQIANFRIHSPVQRTGLTEEPAAQFIQTPSSMILSDNPPNLSLLSRGAASGFILPGPAPIMPVIRTNHFREP